MSVFAVDLYFASRGLQPGGLAGIEHFASVHAHWRIVADLVLLGMFGGFYIVPLYALIQERSDPAYRSRIIAANNNLGADEIDFQIGSGPQMIQLSSPLPAITDTLALNGMTQGGYGSAPTRDGRKFRQSEPR